MLAVGADLEALDAVLDVGDALLLRAVGVHREDLGGVALVVVAQEGDLLALLDPLQVGLRRGRLRQTLHVLAVGVHDVDLRVALVLLDVLVGQREDDAGSVGRGCGLGHASERLEHLGRQHAVLNLDFRLFNHFGVAPAALVGAGGQRQRQ